MVSQTVKTYNVATPPEVAAAEQTIAQLKSELEERERVIADQNHHISLAGQQVDDNRNKMAMMFGAQFQERSNVAEQLRSATQVIQMDASQAVNNANQQLQSTIQLASGELHKHEQANAFHSQAANQLSQQNAELQQCLGAERQRADHGIAEARRLKDRIAQLEQKPIRFIVQSMMNGDCSLRGPIAN